MRIYHQIRQMKNNQDGAVAVLAALFIVILFGCTAFALDLGSAYNQSSKLQNALDSAALAATQELPADNQADPDWTDAVNVADDYAVFNGVSGVTCEPVYKADNPNLIIGIKVYGDKNVAYHFAPVIGVDDSNISKSATAELVPAAGMSGLIPLSLTADKMATITYGVDTTIKYDNQNNADLESRGEGWYGAVVIDQSGGRPYEDGIRDGCTTEVRVGDILERKQGVMVGPTRHAYVDRIECDSCTFENYDEDCPRIVMVPIVEFVDDTHTDVRVLGFASMFIKSIEPGGGNSCEITAVFIEAIYDPDAVPGTAEDYGVCDIILTN